MRCFTLRVACPIVDVIPHSAMRFLENTDLLKIEDILPFFPDFVVIDDFKDEICNALEGYSAHIETLKGEMEEATQNAEAIKKDIAELKNRFVTVEAGERCSKCSYPLLTRQFYVFPCQHSFHADCLIGLVSIVYFRSLTLGITLMFHPGQGVLPTASPEKDRGFAGGALPDGEWCRYRADSGPCSACGSCGGSTSAER